MALSVEAFERAIEGFVRAWREVVDVEDRDGNGGGMWQDVRVCESFGAKYLRITRGLPDLRSDSRSSGEQHFHPVDNDPALEEEEQEVEENDPEALPLPAPPTQPKLAAAAAKAVLYTIHHSPTYQVPVLYLTFLDPPKNKTLPLPSPSEIYTLLVPPGMKAPLRHVGVMGALSMAEHPVSGAPAYFVHPCRTQEVLGALVGSGGEAGLRGDGRALDYLMRWFGIIGASVGLSVPVGVAGRVAGMS